MSDQRRLSAYMEANGITIETQEGPNYDVESYEDGRPAWQFHAYVLKLIHDDLGTEYEFPYRIGIGSTDDPEDIADQIFDHLISDAWSYVSARSFEDWAWELGYDTDSRKAEKIWNGCRECSEKLIEFLGGDEAELEKLALKFERL